MWPHAKRDGAPRVAAGEKARNAVSALEAFKPIAERHSALAVAPFFSEEDYPSSEDYTLGVGVDDTPYGRVYDPDEWRAPENYIHSEIEHLFEAIKMQYNSPQCDYRIFGHSAGAQFTHRLLTFRSDARVVRAVAANSGWYTLPSDGGGDDPNFYMPYGLQGSPVTDDDVRQAFGKELVVLLGSEDTVECFDDPDLRDTDEAVFQGITRLERGLFYFSLARVQSLLLNTELAWLNDIVLGACHDKDEMSPSGGWYLFRDEDEVPCIPSTVTEAGALVINEILADPPSDLAGDANNDGIRDSNDDEFVELVNAGTTAVYLTGWTLGDAEDPGRHRFPVSSRLAPGEAMVVFGNGIPTGAFGGSIVQWAAFGGRLNMSNDGDVLTLADHAGTIHSQVS